ncbi:MAG TPA: hypothetical protein VHR65_08565 [Solirubrobacterales bacterium]|jgi:uncharacterized protein YuzE|nr:hypothetical protein [Solirubrobacterales bacterium]
MRADYDSEADALSIELCQVEHFDRGDQVDDGYCNVGIVAGRVVAVELLNPADHLDLLRLAARRYELDAAALIAAAQAALAAPDRLVVMNVAERAAA